MTTKRRKQQHESNLFLEILVLPYCRLSVILASKTPRKNISKNVGLFIFDLFCSAFWFACLIMLGKFKLFGMGDFRFIWFVNVIIVSVFAVAFLIGFLRRKYGKPDEDEEEIKEPKSKKVKFSKEEFTESVKHNPHVIKKKVEEFEEQGDFKDNPDMVHLSDEQLMDILKKNPEISVRGK